MALLDGEALREEWEAALADSGLPDGQTVLLVIDTVEAGAPTSADYAPGFALEPDGLMSETMAQLGNAHPDVHRIAVLRDVPPGELGRALIAAKLRHELEHARQWERWGSVPWELSLLLDEMIEVLVGGDERADAMLYRAQPAEMDCNAAASCFVASRFSAGTLAAIRDSDDHVLVSARRAPDIETLPVRSVAFLYQFDRLSSTLVDPERGDFRRRLGAISQQALDVWDQLASAAGSWPGAR